MADARITRWLQLDGGLNPVLGIVGNSHGPLAIPSTPYIDTTVAIHIGVFWIHRFNIVFLVGGTFIRLHALQPLD
jgi:hypothetical protein